MKIRHFFYARHRMEPVFIVAYVPRNFVHFRLVLFLRSKEGWIIGCFIIVRPSILIRCFILGVVLLLSFSIGAVQAGPCELPDFGSVSPNYG
jgi:hypothetical protein